MRLLWVIGINEYDTSFCGAKLSNRFLCIIFAFLQLSVVIASFLQHVCSFIEYKHIFNCHSSIPVNATWNQQFLAYDIIIFDFGLMHKILGTTECVANYLDGGYMRSAWCVEQASALMLLIVTLLCIPKPLWLLWPEAFGGYVDQQLGGAMFIYILGVALNWLFTFILWHYYWGMEMKYSPPPITFPIDL